MLRTIQVKSMSDGIRQRIIYTPVTPKFLYPWSQSRDRSSVTGHGLLCLLLSIKDRAYGN